MAVTSRAAAVAGLHLADATAGCSVQLAWWLHSLRPQLRPAASVLLVEQQHAAQGGAKGKAGQSHAHGVQLRQWGRCAVGDTFIRSDPGRLHLAIARICKSSAGNPGDPARMLPPAGRSSQAAFSGTACISRRPRAAPTLAQRCSRERALLSAAACFWSGFLLGEALVGSGSACEAEKWQCALYTRMYVNAAAACGRSSC